MTAQVWPFKPRLELLESLEWLTDVFQAKSAEQRIALRTVPRRTFYLDMVLTDYEYSAAREMMRSSQAADGFMVPDWGQTQDVGIVTAGSSVVIPADLTYVDIGDNGFLWQSNTLSEWVTVSYDSNGLFLLDTVVNNYTSAKFMPLWPAQCPQGMTNERGAARINRCDVAMLVTENNDLAATTYDQYRNHDVIPICPVVGQGSFNESIVWESTTFDNQTSNPYLLRKRDLVDMSFQMRWHEFDTQSKYELRQWLHSRRGRQKAFWLSSLGKDYEPAASISGTTVTVYTPVGLSTLGRSSPFDIDIYDGSTHYYRRVTTFASGTPVGGRNTLDFTIDSSATIALGDIVRISLMRCARFDADRVELQHVPGAGMAVQIPCLEVPVP